MATNTQQGQAPKYAGLNILPQFIRDALNVQPMVDRQAHLINDQWDEIAAARGLHPTDGPISSGRQQALSDMAAGMRAQQLSVIPTVLNALRYQQSDQNAVSPKTSTPSGPYAGAARAISGGGGGSYNPFAGPGGGAPATGAVNPFGDLNDWGEGFGLLGSQTGAWRDKQGNLPGSPLLSNQPQQANPTQTALQRANSWATSPSGVTTGYSPYGPSAANWQPPGGQQVPTPGSGGAAATGVDPSKMGPLVSVSPSKQSYPGQTALQGATQWATRTR